MLKQGDKAPDFSLKDKDGKFHTLYDVKSDYVVVYFYPKDNTPGCTIEAQMMNKDLDKFKMLKTTVIGISGGDERSKKKFCDKYGFKFLLLSDTDFAVSTKFGAYGQKSFMGKKFKGIFRNTYVLDKNKKVVKIFEKVKPEIHSDELLEFINGRG